MLEPQRYPFDHPPYDRTPKTRPSRPPRQSAWTADWLLPPLAVTFANEGDDPVPGEPIGEARPNIHGAPAQTCRLVGECDVGCNYGAKNTLDYTYLHGRMARGRRDPHRAARCARSSRARAAATDPLRRAHDEREGARPTQRAAARRHRGPPRALRRHARHDLPAAANRAALPGLSPRLGAAASAATATCSRSPSAAQTGLDGHAHRAIDPLRPGDHERDPRRRRARRDGGGGRGFYIEDAGYPEFVPLDAAGRRRAGRRCGARRWSPGGSCACGCAATATATSAPRSPSCSATAGCPRAAAAAAGMGRDIPDGRMSLAERRLPRGRLAQGRRLARQYFDRVRAESRRAGRGARRRTSWTTRSGC